MTGNGVPGPFPPAGGPQQQPQQGFGYQQQYGGGQQPPPPAAHAPYPGQAPHPGQAPYGGQAPHPGQAPYAAPAPAPAKKGKAGLVILLVVALLVLGGAGVGGWFLLNGSSADEAVLWSQPGYKGKMPPGESVKQVEGTWTTDKAVIQTMPDGVKAYDLATGNRLWATRIPGDSNTTCSAPRQSEGGVGIVAYGDNKACNHLVAYDLDTGKQLWTKEIKNKPNSKPKPGDSFTPGDTNPDDIKDNYLARSGGVVVTQGTAGAQAFKVSDGSPAWTPERSAKCDGASYTGGKALIRVRACHTKPVLGKPYDEVSLIDPDTGKAKWTHTFRPEGEDGLDAGMAIGGRVISTDPVVLYPEREDMGIIALDSETGKIRSRFAPRTPAKYVQTWGPEGTPWMEAAAFGKTFVMSVSEAQEANLLVAYDLDSGKLLWKTKPDKSKDFHPLVDTDGGKVLVYERLNSSDKGPELAEYNAATGARKTLAEYPTTVAHGLDLFARPTVRKNTLFLSAIADRTFNPNEAYGLIALKMSAPE
ncbi:PQQ-binding-like beta-propeller repeat protein [Streptomyces sp. NPDC101227]|uniref:outer membrane protein assembly factor BamB family protein n=1 Tax=Streptomyces sp. NPDC101227 TaxID=3366136 RepID=UPI003804ADC7